LLPYSSRRKPNALPANARNPDIPIMGTSEKYFNLAPDPPSVLLAEFAAKGRGNTCFPTEHWRVLL
jgi:hypothetical protein